jgi:hypothetical protein
LAIDNQFIMLFSLFSGRLIIDEIYFLPGDVKMMFLAPENQAARWQKPGFSVIM